MSKQSYYLYKRKNSSGNFTYYVKYKLDNGKYSSGKSTRQTTNTAAISWVESQIVSELVVTKKNMKFSKFTENLFNFEGKYVQSKVLRGKSYGHRHAKNQAAKVKNHLLPYFGNIAIKQIDNNLIDTYTLHLINKDYSSSTVNSILGALEAILKEAYKQDYIGKMPILEKVAKNSKKRGVLSVPEVHTFFSQPWSDNRYYTLNLLAATTGMRMGEIMALQRKKVFDGYVEVSASWEREYGLKGTKTGKNRMIPLIPKVQEVLESVMELSPFKEPDDLIFFGRKRKVPLSQKTIETKFYKALNCIGITEEIRSKRNIVFHSWRHLFNSVLINAHVPELKVQELTGHSSQQMTKNYFHAEDFTNEVKIIGDIF